MSYELSITLIGLGIFVVIAIIALAITSSKDVQKDNYGENSNNSKSNIK